MQNFVLTFETQSDFNTFNNLNADACDVLDALDMLTVEYDDDSLEIVQAFEFNAAQN